MANQGTESQLDHFLISNAPCWLATYIVQFGVKQFLSLLLLDIPCCLQEPCLKLVLWDNKVAHGRAWHMYINI